MDEKLESLLDAARILDSKLREVCNEPIPIYAAVLHARDYVNFQLDGAMRGMEGEN